MKRQGRLNVSMSIAHFVVVSKDSELQCRCRVVDEVNNASSQLNHLAMPCRSTRFSGRRVLKCRDQPQIYVLLKFIKLQLSSPVWIDV